MLGSGEHCGEQELTPVMEGLLSSIWNDNILWGLWEGNYRVLRKHSFCEGEGQRKAFGKEWSLQRYSEEPSEEGMRENSFQGRDANINRDPEVLACKQFYVAGRWSIRRWKWG